MKFFPISSASYTAAVVAQSSAVTGKGIRITRWIANPSELVYIGFGEDSVTAPYFLIAPGEVRYFKDPSRTYSTMWYRAGITSDDINISISPDYDESFEDIPSKTSFAYTAGFSDDNGYSGKVKIEIDKLVGARVFCKRGSAADSNSVEILGTTDFYNDGSRVYFYSPSATNCTIGKVPV